MILRPPPDTWSPTSKPVPCPRSRRAPDVVVGVRDYDVDGVEDKYLHTDNDGRHHTVEWSSNGS